MVRHALEVSPDAGSECAQEGRGQVFELLMMNYGMDARDRTRTSVMALLKKEMRYEETDAQKAKLDEQDKKREE